MTLIDEICIPETGALYNFGEIGSEELEPKLWIKNDEITDVSCGDEFVVIITRSGRVFSYGKNDWGQLGLGDTKTILNPSCVKGLKSANEKAVHVACGRYHTLISTESNKLYGFGSNNDGQLGIRQSITCVAIPTQITEWEYGYIKQLSAGGAFSAAINENGSLYTWGSNSESQLGLMNTSEDAVYVPTEVTFFTSPVSSVSCGSYHTAAISQGQLYVWGEAADDKLGGNFRDNQKIPQKIRLNTQIQHISCGHNHTVCLSESGYVYTWGKGDSGQLGLGPHELNSPSPTLLRIPNLIKSNVDNEESMEKFSSVSAGENHTVIISTRGLALSFGDGRHGKLGNIGGANNYSNFMCPRPIQKLSSEFWIYNTKCGGCHTVVLVRNRKPHELLKKGQHDFIHSSIESDNQSIYSETTSSNTSVLRARRNRRNNAVVDGTKLPTLTQSNQPENGNILQEDSQVSNEIVEDISRIQNFQVQSVPNGKIKNPDDHTDSKNKTNLEDNNLEKTLSFEENVNKFLDLLDESYFETENKDLPDKDFSSQHTECRDDENEKENITKPESTEDPSTQKASNDPEITNIGCLTRCRKPQESRTCNIL